MFKKSAFYLSVIFAFSAMCVSPALSAQRMDVANAFYRAASLQGQKGVQRLLQRGYRLEQTDANGNTALCLASAYQDDAAFKVLLRAGASTRARCFTAQSKRNPQKSAANQNEMTYLGGGLGDTVYGENRKYLEAGSGFVWENAYTVGLGLLLLGGVGVALASKGHGGSGNAYVPSGTPAEDILSSELPSCLGGYWTKNGDAYSCTCPTGKKLINGVCVEDKPLYQTNDITNDKEVIVSKESDALLVELGASVVNNGTVRGSTSATENNLVALKADGFSPAAYSGVLAPETLLNAQAASKAINNGTIILTQNNEYAGSLHGIKAVAGATGINSPSGTIILNVQSSNPAYAMYAEEEGYGLNNQGIIDLNLTGKASDTYGLYTAQKRGLVNQGTINMLITNPIFLSSDADDLAAVRASDAQNGGTILLRRGEPDPTTANENNLNVYGLWVKDGGKAENTATGFISLDVTKTPFFVQGIYADQGTSGMVNSGRIEIFGELSSKESIKGIGGAYAMRWTGGYGSILNEGEIQSRTCITNINGVCTYENLSITGDAYLTFLSGFRGSITNRADLLLYVTNNANSSSNWTLSGISLVVNSENDQGILNEADIKIDVTEGTVAKTSKAMAISTTSAYAHNNGDIYIHSKTNNLDLYGIAGYGSNGQYSKISILGEGDNTNLFGIAKVSYDDAGNCTYIYDPYSENKGNIVMEHHKTGTMWGLLGQNYGTIYLNVNPDTPFAHPFKEVMGLLGETNTGSVKLSLQKGSFSVAYEVDESANIRSYSPAVLFENYPGANMTNSGPLTFVAENRTVNPMPVYDENGDPVLDENGDPVLANTDASYFGVIYGIAARKPTFAGSRSVVNSSVIKMDASGQTEEGYPLMGDIAGINAQTYNVTNESGAKIDIDLNGPGTTVGIYTHSGFYKGESLPAIYKTYNNGTIDIRATNTIDQPIYADNIVYDDVVLVDAGNNIYSGTEITASTPDQAMTEIPFAVVGMMTNSIAVNNGHILMQVAGDAKSAGMVAYNGGIAVNNGEIKFTGNANNFTALYGTGSRIITKYSVEEKQTQQEVTTTDPDTGNQTTQTVTVTEAGQRTDTTTQYSTVYNFGTIIVNSNYYLNENSADVIGGGDGARCAPLAYTTKGSDPNVANQIVVTEYMDGSTVTDTTNYLAGDELPLSPGSSLSGALTQIPTVVLNEGVNYISEGKGSFEAQGSLVKGSVVAGLTNVLGSNRLTYVAQGRGEGAIVGNGDASLLSLESASYMFDANFEENASNANGLNIVMQKKDFDTIVENKSLANFLENNYVMGNNEAFFDEIKAIGNAVAFTSAMNGLIGQDTIARFNHEDLTAMREISLQMNETMFANSDKPFFETQGKVDGFAFKNNNNSSGQYALATKRISPRWKIGYAMSKTDIKTEDNNDSNRNNEMFQVFAPIGYENGGLKLISTPQIGFARGHYTRKGYNDESYKGVMEKRIFALMNEARYPVKVMGGFELAPTVEFNAIAYNQKGGEDKKEYSLTMPSDNQLSVEAGFGLHANKQIGNVKFNAGLMMYKEFADPYNVKMGMNGMEGSFNLYDNTWEYRGVASFGFGYDVDMLNIYGKVQQFIENDNYTNVKAGIKYSF